MRMFSVQREMVRRSVTAQEYPGLALAVSARFTTWFMASGRDPVPTVTIRLAWSGAPGQGSMETSLWSLSNGEAI